MEFNIIELFKNASGPVWVVVGVMLLMLVWCIYVAIDRIIALGRARRASRTLAAEIVAPLAEGDGKAALEIVKDPKYKTAYLAHMLQAALKEFLDRPDEHGIEAASRAIERITVTENADLRRGLSILATTGATAPFVGLVGTIFGIINSFVGMAETGSGGLGAVSAGIAEALVTTALGISVAIIGVWMFNYFNHRIEQIANDLSVAAQELIDWCEKQILPPLENAAK